MSPAQYNLTVQNRGLKHFFSSFSYFPSFYFFLSNLQAAGDYDEMLDSDDGDDHDHYLERMKREGQSRLDEQDDDDDDESDDEDYQIPDDFSEVDEE